MDNLKNLVVLILNHNNISKIEGLDNLNNLQRLILSSNNISKIEGLDNLNNLQKLILKYLYKYKYFKSRNVNTNRADNIFITK